MNSSKRSGRVCTHGCSRSGTPWNCNTAIRPARAWSAACFKGASAAPFVGVLRCAAAPGEPNAQLLENGHGLGSDAIARIGEAHGPRNAILRAGGVDRADLRAQLAEGPERDAEMIASVIADLESVLVQFLDLFPRHVVLLVRGK